MNNNGIYKTVDVGLYQVSFQGNTIGVDKIPYQNIIIQKFDGIDAQSKPVGEPKPLYIKGKDHNGKEYMLPDFTTYEEEDFTKLMALKDNSRLIFWSNRNYEVEGALQKHVSELEEYKKLSDLTFHNTYVAIAHTLDALNKSSHIWKEDSDAKKGLETMMDIMVKNMHGDNNRELFEQFLIHRPELFTVTPKEYLTEELYMKAVQENGLALQYCDKQTMPLIMEAAKTLDKDIADLDNVTATEGDWSYFWGIIVDSELREDAQKEYLEYCNEDNEIDEER